MEETRAQPGDLEGLIYAESNYDALKDCNALILLTEWAHFRNPDFGRMKELLKDPVVFDGRNIYSPNVMRTFGFDYFAIGRAPVLEYSTTGASLVNKL